MRQIRRDKTAIRRTELSRPLRLVLDAQLLAAGGTVFDYGCGHGSDVRFLRGLGYEAAGWDPAHAPDEALAPAEIVNLGFVVNVIEDDGERVEAVRRAWTLAQRVLVVSARLRSDVRELPDEEFSDGYLTRTDTFQRFFTQIELRDWLEAILGERPVPASPGVFLVFRHAEERERYLAARFRRRLAEPHPSISALLYEQHKQLVDPLVDFFTERGRLPVSEELSAFTDLVGVFGSVPRAFAVVRRATGSGPWESIQAQRNEDLLLYLASTLFNRPPRFSDLAPELRIDVRAFHGNYTKAQDAARALLMQVGDQDSIDAACRGVNVGKETPQALYVHRCAIDQLPTILRVYEACARGVVGEVDGANIVKLHRYRPQVSYLCYPRFEQDPHPALTFSAVVSLDEIRTSLKDYSKALNPPVLHRKEQFVPAGYPGRAKFAALTRQEERAGLMSRPSSIGMRVGWEKTLASAGYRLRGHRLVRHNHP